MIYTECVGICERIKPHNRKWLAWKARVSKSLVIFFIPYFIFLIILETSFICKEEIESNEGILNQVYVPFIKLSWFYFNKFIIYVKRTMHMSARPSVSKR